jgi:hypothetical protein
MLIVSLIVILASCATNNGWGVAAGLFLLLISPACDS